MGRLLKFRRLWPLGMILVAAGCGGGGSSTTGPSGNVTVMLTDSPFSGATAVLVTFTEVSAHLSGGDFLPVSTATRTCDLKKLVNVQDVLASGSLTAGHYTQIRLAISSATLYTGGLRAADAGPCSAMASSLTPTRMATAHPLEIPSGEVKLNREFDAPSTGTTTITLDFDGDRSIKETGGGTFIMTPVIAVVSVQ